MTKVEADKEELLLIRKMQIAEEMALEAVLGRLDEHDKNPLIKPLYIQKDASAISFLRREREKKTLKEFEWWLSSDPGAWRAKMRALGMGRSCKLEMERLQRWYRTRSSSFYNDAIRTETLEAEEASKAVTEAELHHKAIAWCLKSGIRPPKWENKSHCLDCGTMPSPKAGGECQWCETFKEIHEENDRAANSGLSGQNKNGNEPSGVTTTEEGAGSITCEK